MADDIKKDDNCHFLLDRMERQLLAINKYIRDTVISTDSTGSIVFWNNGAEKMFGYSESEVKDFDAINLIPERNRPKVLNLLAKQVKSGSWLDSCRCFEVEALHKDGTEFSIELSVTSWESNNECYFTCIIRNITKRKKTEAELLQVHKLESICLLAGGIAHDFNNILTGIITNLFIAKMDMDIEKDAYKMIVEAEKAAFRATRLTKQFLTFANGDTPIKELISIRTIIEDSVGFTLSGSNVDYELNIDENLWVVNVDRGQIDQVINNLIINADQAMPNGGTIYIEVSNITISGEVTNGTEEYLPLDAGDYVKVSITDNGVGIPYDIRQKIFDPYFTTKPNGSGLGLAISFSAINRHGGFITVKSHPRKGATFLFYLPGIREEHNNTIQDNLKPITDAGRVLVMDDDLIVKRAVEMILKHIGYSVESVIDGNAAVKRYQSAIDNGVQFDLVIMDLTIPGGMGGKDAITKILAINPDAKVIVTSGYSNDSAIKNFAEYGFKGAIKKPFTIAEFKKVLLSVI